MKEVFFSIGTFLALAIPAIAAEPTRDHVLKDVDRRAAQAERRCGPEDNTCKWDIRLKASMQKAARTDRFVEQYVATVKKSLPEQRHASFDLLQTSWRRFVGHACKQRASMVLRKHENSPQVEFNECKVEYQQTRLKEARHLRDKAVPPAIPASAASAVG
ncbi:hypothetical protein [Methylibium rhizosphaerae]|uniref:hypothetical protein n=1 Tax=Methylibium rhizosphaerae TaxID=2570323 RepID=UPI00112B2B46|nr:hypothetical protein [Methylibium rhizosphaerae]